MATKIKVMVVSIGLDMVAMPVAPTFAVSPGGTVVDPANPGAVVEVADAPALEQTEVKPPLIVNVRTIEGRPVDLGIPVSSTSGLTPGKIYELEFVKVEDKS